MPADPGTSPTASQQNESSAGDSLTGYVVANTTKTDGPEGPNVTKPPVADATVRIEELDRTVETDLFGFFEFEDIDDGTYTLDVSAEGYEPANRTVTVSGTSHTVVELNQTERLYTLEVSVEAKSTSIDLRDALVTVDGETKFPDENGTVRFEHRSAGGHDVSVTHPGYQSWSDTVSLGPRSKRVSVRMAPRTPHDISGSITDEHGRTVDHGTVRVTGVNDAGDVLVGPRLVHLDETDGEIEADRLPPLPYAENKYRVNVTATGYETNTTSVQANVGATSSHSTPFVLDQKQTTTVVTDQAAIYEDAAGEPMPIIESEVIFNGTDDVTEDIRIVANTNESGQQTIERLLPGKYQVQFTRYVLYQFIPGEAETVSGEVIVRGFKEAAEECERATEAGGPFLVAGRAPYYCRPMTEFEEVSRTVSVDVVDDDPNTITVNRSTPTGSADVATMAANGTTGENRTAVWESLAGTTVDVTVPDNVAAQTSVPDDATGYVQNIDDESYFITSVPVAGQTWRSGQAGTVDLSLYPGIYGPQALKAVNASESQLDFSHFYALSEQRNTLWVHPNRTTDRSLQLYPTWTDVEGTVNPYEVPDATIDMRGEGWEPDIGGNVSAVPTLRIPEWGDDLLESSYGGVDVTLTSNESGSYSGRLPLDNYTTTISADGFVDLETADVLDSASPRSQFVSHTLEPAGGNVTKMIVSHNIETLDGDEVCSGTNSYNTTASLYSERFGEIIPGTDVPAGNYTAFHYNEPPRNITVGPGEDVTVLFFDEEKDPSYDPSCAQDDPYPYDLVNGPYPDFNLHGTVTAASDGQPIEGATVTLEITYDTGTDTFSATTDADGIYTIAGFIADPSAIVSTNVSARKGTDYIPNPGESIALTQGEEHVRDIALDSAQGELRIRVADPVGKPLRDARVTVGSGIAPGWQPTIDGGWTRFQPPESDTPTILPVDVGEYEVQVRKPGYYDAGSNPSVSANVTVAVGTSSTSERYERTVTLTQLPDPKIRDTSMDRGPSNDSTGLFLEGVKLPTKATAIIEPPDVSGFEEPPTDIRLIANRGPDERGGIVLDSLSPSHDRVEEFANGSYKPTFEFDIGELPAGRNNFTVVVRTKHGATNEKLIRQTGNPYWIDVLPTPTFLSGLLSAARVPDSLTGVTNTSDLSLSDSIERQSSNYNWTPEGSIKAEYDDYITYGVDIGVGIEMRQDNPVDSTDDAAESFGFADQTMPSLSIEFDGENRSFSVDGGIAFDGSADAAANLQNPFFSKVESNANWNAGFTTGGETTWEEPTPGGGDFTETFRSKDNVSGGYKVDFKAFIRNEYLVSALGAPPVVGTWLNRVDTNLYVTASFGTTINWLMVYDGAGGLLGYAILPEGQEPASLDPEKSGLDLGVDLGVGAGAQVYGHDALEGNILPSFTFEFNPLAGSPGFERITGQVDASLKVSVSKWGPSKTWKWDLAGPGTLWESEGADAGSETAAAVAGGQRLFASHEGIARNTTAAVTPIRTGYGTPDTDRYWRDANYSRFFPGPAATNNTLLAETYPGAEPSIAAQAGDDAQVAYAIDDISAPTLSTHLESSSLDQESETWSDSEAVPETDDVADPEIASLGGDRGVVVWRSMGALDSDTNPLLAMNDTELHYSVYDGETWHDGGAVTDNAEFERNPAVASDRGQFLSVWAAVRSGYLVDTTDIDLKFAFGETSDGSPGSVETGRVASDLTLAGSPAVGYADGRGLVVYPVDTDGNTSTTGDVRLEASIYRDGSWSSPTVLTDAGPVEQPTVLVTDEGMEAAWVQNESTVMRLSRRDGDWTEPVEALDERGVRGLELAGRADSRALVWRGFGPTARSIYYATANGSDKGFGPATLLDGSAAYTSHSATFDSSADTLYVAALAGANATESIEEAPDLRVFSQPVTGASGAADVQLSDLSLNRSAVSTGEAVEVTASALNDGTDEATTAFEFAVNESVDATRTITLQAGDSHELTFVTSFDAPGEYELSVNGQSVGTVTVTETTERTQTEGGDGSPSDDDGGNLWLWLLLLALLAILAGGVYYWYAEAEGVALGATDPEEPTTDTDSDDGHTASEQSDENEETEEDAP